MEIKAHGPIKRDMRLSRKEMTKNKKIQLGKTSLAQIFKTPLRNLIKYILFWVIHSHLLLQKKIHIFPVRI